MIEMHKTQCQAVSKLRSKYWPRDRLTHTGYNFGGARATFDFYSRPQLQPIRADNLHNTLSADSMIV